MISCTEFIASYSELFSYLDETYGKDEVTRFWKYLFEPDGKGIPLIGFVQREGIRGCFSYWSGTLNEEAADFTIYLNEKRGFYMEVMHHCPSKGRLLELEKEIGIKPYPDYCLHCDSYRSACEQVGLKYIFNFQGVENASCSMLVYDPKVFDGRVIIDEDTLVMDRRAADNEYFHPDFHSSMNMGIHYLGENYGGDAVRNYLTRYTRNVYRRLICEIREEGLSALERHIQETYAKEKASGVLETVLAADTLAVTVKRCPAVEHLHKTGREVSAWYRSTTEVVMEVLAHDSGYAFAMEYYDDATGAAAYRFWKR